MTKTNSQIAVRVKFYGPLRQFVEELDTTAHASAGTTVRNLILQMGVPQDQIVYTMCLINERRVPLDTELTEGDFLDVFQPVAGG